jgi:nitroimidazol reductase NimA-like FMN-containing flavoprotein (pyridoxamine 5'-phosphate oxidase superfamily)
VTSAATYDRNGLEVLSLDECMSLLRRTYVGRLAFVSAGEPVILPVNYAVYGSSIVFRSAFGGKLDAAEHGRAASFEIDGIDEVYQRGWSVLVKGSLYDVTDDETLAELNELPLRPWARRVERPFWIRLVPNEVTGRRIV